MRAIIMPTSVAYINNYIGCYPRAESLMRPQPAFGCVRSGKGQPFFCLYKLLIMIFNKELGITEEDVLNQEDIKILNTWRVSIESQMVSLLAGTDDYRNLPHRKKIKYQYLFSLRRMVKHRISECLFEIKKDSGWISERSKRKDRTLSMEFMRIAKRELSKEEYSRLLELAKSKIEEEG